MKNITLAIPEDLLRKSRAYAKRHGTTLNELVRNQLRKLTTNGEKTGLDSIEEALDSLGIDTTQKFDRDEIHER